MNDEQLKGKATDIDGEIQKKVGEAVGSGVRPEYNLDFTDPAINRNPWPYMDEVRAIGPAVWNEPSQSWLVTGYKESRAILMNEADFRPAGELYEEIFGGPTVLGADNPRHLQLRSVWDKYLRRDAMQNYVDLINEIADKRLGAVLEQVRAGEVVDFVPHLRKIPTELTARMIGVPVEDCEDFIRWGHCMVEQFHLYNAPNAEAAEQMRKDAVDATKALHDYSGRVLEERRRAGNSDDLLGVLATTAIPMTEQEKRSYITIFIEGAQDTSTKLMTSALGSLALHPDQKKALVADRALIPQALEEVMRWHGPVSLDIRIARHANVQIGGIHIPEGDHVSPALGAANRDPSRWSDPHAFNIFRPAQPHLGFGFGIHICMGMNVARILGEIVLNKILDAIPDYRLAEDGLDYGRSFIIRGPVRLPLTL
ncbi:MAG: cytochrome P450 [Massilia sp.]